MTEIPRTPPGSDAELAARIEQATRPAPLTPAERARFAARVEERIERAAPRRVRLVPLAWLGFAGALAAAALFAFASNPPAPAPAPDAEALSAATLAESWQEELLYAPEWIERHEGFVDAELLPESYALASALLEP